MISTKLLKELQKIIEEDYGIVLRFEEVSDIGNSLVGFFDLLLEIRKGGGVLNE